MKCLLEFLRFLIILLGNIEEDSASGFYEFSIEKWLLACQKYKDTTTFVKIYKSAKCYFIKLESKNYNPF